jgi:transmembrane sensor
MKQTEHFETLLPSYFSGKLSPEEKQTVEDWKNASKENGLIFKNAEKIWKGLDLLQEMRTYDISQALLKVNNKIGQQHLNKHSFLFYWQRIAAVLLLPFLILAGTYLFLDNQSKKDDLIWQTISTPPGVKSQTQLPDGTKVWLNSESSLCYPSSFAGGERNIKLTGEAYFEVAKDKRHPFHVDLGKIGIEVVGTAFNVIHYENEKQTEVVLTSGKIKLLEQKGNKRRTVTEMEPGEKAMYTESSDKISIQRVDTEKYTSWIHGRLFFRDDAMSEVVRRLNRWFNVEIEIPDPEIAQYVYTATFSDETIEQILDLFKKTSPIEYKIIPYKRMNNGSFIKQRIILQTK